MSASICFHSGTGRVGLQPSSSAAITRSAVDRSRGLNSSLLSGHTCHARPCNAACGSFWRSRALRRPTLSRKYKCGAVEDDTSPSSKTKDDSTISRVLDVFPSLGEGVGSTVSLLLWAAFVGYAIFLSPNQTSRLDTYFIKKLVGLERDDIPINTLYYCVFNALGLYPLIFTALLQPSGKSGNKVPAWPFTTASFGLGFLSLGLYFALWKPSAEVTSPPTKQQTEGVGNLSLKVTESAITSVLILLVALGLIGTAAFAATDSQQWISYFQLFEGSRLVHVSTLDFMILTLSAPFWMSNDAQKRNWEGRSKWLPVLSFIPLLGPAIYLVLRPKAN